VKSSTGFTLIELLISMSLLSMVVLIGSSAYGLFSQRWSGQLGGYDLLLHQSRSVILVQDVLDSLVPYVAFDAQGRPFVYFEGNRNGFVGVSSKSIYSAENFSVARLSSRQNEDLTFDILYEEWPMDDQLLVSVDQYVKFSPPIILFKSVLNPTFEYFGFSDVGNRDSAEGAPQQQAEWSGTYKGIDALFVPSKARLSFSSIAGSFQIQSSLASEKPGLLSRYSPKNYGLSPGGEREYNRNSDGATDVSGDDCDC